MGAISHEGSVTYGVQGADALDSGPLETLYACAQSGQLFALWQARLVERAAKQEPATLRQFYCPVCPASVLRLGAQPVAKCGLCGWTSECASELVTLSDLFVRDAEPWPRVLTAVQDAVLRARERRGGDEAKGVDPLLEDGEMLVSSNNTIVLQEGVHNVMQLPPRRRMGQKRVDVVSPYSGVVVGEAVVAPRGGDNAARFLPHVTAAVVSHECGYGGDGAELWLRILNSSELDMVVWVGSKTVALRAGTKSVINMKTTLQRVIHGKLGVSEFVAELDVGVQLDHPELRRHRWRYVMFVWHSRARMRNDQMWHLAMN